MDDVSGANDEKFLAASGALGREPCGWCGRLRFRIGGYARIAVVPLGRAVAPSLCVARDIWAAYLLLRLLMAWVVGVWGVGDEVLSRNCGWCL